MYVPFKNPRPPVPIEPSYVYFLPEIENKQICGYGWLNPCVVISYPHHTAHPFDIFAVLGMKNSLPSYYELYGVVDTLSQIQLESVNACG